MAISRTRRQVRLSRALGIPLTPKAARYMENFTPAYATITN